MVEVTPQHRTERILDGAVNNTMKGSISKRQKRLSIAR